MTRNDRELRSPFFTPEETLEIVIGAVNFRDEVIINLRNQIANLRQFIIDEDWVPTMIDDVQYKHQREPRNETNS